MWGSQDSAFDDQRYGIRWTLIWGPVPEGVKPQTATLGTPWSRGKTISHIRIFAMQESREKERAYMYLSLLLKRRTEPGDERQGSTQNWVAAASLVSLCLHLQLLPR